MTKEDNFSNTSGEESSESEVKDEVIEEESFVEEANTTNNKINIVTTNLLNNIKEENKTKSTDYNRMLTKLFKLEATIEVLNNQFELERKRVGELTKELWEAKLREVKEAVEKKNTAIRIKELTDKNIKNKNKIEKLKKQLEEERNKKVENQNLDDKEMIELETTYDFWIDKLRDKVKLVFQIAINQYGNPNVNLRPYEKDGRNRFKSKFNKRNNEPSNKESTPLTTSISITSQSATNGTNSNSSTTNNTSNNKSKNRSGETQNKQERPVCFICKRPGHFANTCRNKY